ncbi:MAG: nucleotidyltransferase domain-containing protein [Thermoplasmata archaeon]|nr:nucleotidyltransferase domain-containing protein [Thermoplasmata archaeon]
MKMRVPEENQNQIPDAVRKATERFKERALKVEGVEKVILYGSAARGDFNEESDIDLLVLLKEAGIKERIKTTQELELIAFQILMDTGGYISLQTMTVQEFERLKTNKNSFLVNVLKEGVAIG